MLRSTRRSLVRRMKRCEPAYQTNAGSLPEAPIFRKIGIVVFFLIASVTLTQFFPAFVPNARSAGPTYVYDSAGRMVGVNDGSGNVAQYKYDGVGNLQSITKPNGTQLVIIAVSPNNGPVGTQFLISGDGFGTSPAQNTVAFNNGHNGQVNATIISSTQTTIVAIVPTGAAPGLNTLTTPTGEASLPFQFTQN